MKRKWHETERAGTVGLASQRYRSRAAQQQTKKENFKKN